MAGLAGASARG
uniref:Uncharacterized protein n=1 Tax=Arundo donax TaxID=35708 RepID=A0A0A9A4L1_ARUDO